MTRDQFWQPDRQTRSAISRGNRLRRDYLARKKQEYQLTLIARITERLESIDADWCTK